MTIEEPALAYGKRKYSIEEYLEMENASEEKHEYYQGEIFAMAGGKGQHNIVAGNIFANLWNKLKGKSCRPYNSDTRIHIKKNTLLTYPDVSVFCGDTISLNDDDFNFLNPTLIFEVLSPSTKDYNLGVKFQLYRDIPSLKGYVTVDPDTISIQSWHINAAGNWELIEHKNINETLRLQSIDVSIELSEIYEGVTSK